MTAVDLDALDKLRGAATPGLWKLWGMDVMADQDGTANYDTAVPVAHTYFRDENDKPRTWDASLICEMQRALPDLIAEARKYRALREAVAGLAAEFDRPVAGITFGGLPQRALFGGGDVCYRLRSVVATVDSP